jgi:alpha-mannosidase
MGPVIHLLCNAHLDPVWLWEWQEGAAQVLSTFRTAADLCEEFDGFVFNHNEVILYRWVEEYEPELFSRIQRLVKEGKWHIMGGWFLQPDCNMPSGESFTRQALVGKHYFRNKFGVEPTTAISFDPFGHTRGLVQILAKSGSDSYLFMRPNATDRPLPDDDFEWIGYDGSRVTAHRFSVGYNSGLGLARKKVEAWMASHPGDGVHIVPWGVGNHGGGPSRQDLRDLAVLIDETRDVEISHSTPEAFFKQLRGQKSIAEYAGDLNSWAPGCYTSQIRIKQGHRALENEYYRAEKMASHAAVTTGLAYPSEELESAMRDLLTSEFHDILPGSSIQIAEEAALRLLDHGREIVSRLSARSFFSLCSGQPKAEDGSYPVFLYNPHPYPVTGVFACEFNMADQNWSDTWTVFEVFRDGERVPAQVEREASNINLDWRKCVVFEGTLDPGSINRFDARQKILDRRPPFPSISNLKGADVKDGLDTSSEHWVDNRHLYFSTDRMELRIDLMTGYVAEYRVDGETVMDGDGLRPIVITDYEDPWGSTVQEFRRLEGVFTLLDPAEAARFAGIDDRVIDPIRLVEDGPARAVVEVSFGYRDSRLLLTYVVPKRGASFEVIVDVLWQEKNRMLKLAVPTAFTHAQAFGQVAFGVEPLLSTGKELVTQKWQCVTSVPREVRAAGDVVDIVDDDRPALLCIDDGIYGSDFKFGELRLSLLRSAAYSALGGVAGREPVAKHRHTHRIDQGSRRFSFKFVGGAAKTLLETADREALSFNEPPYILSFYPSGSGEAPESAVEIDDESIILSAFKRGEDGNCWILRLYNPTRANRTTGLKIPALCIDTEVAFTGYEVKTFRVAGNDIVETNLLEDPLV